MDRTSSSTPYFDKEAQDELLSRDKQSSKTDEHSRMCKVCNIPVSQAGSFFAKRGLFCLRVGWAKDCYFSWVWVCQTDFEPRQLS